MTTLACTVSQKSLTKTFIIQTMKRKKVGQMLGRISMKRLVCIPQFNTYIIILLTKYDHSSLHDFTEIQCCGVLLIWIEVGQGPTALAVGAAGGCLDIFSLIYHFSLLSPSLCETARCRLKYCLKGPLNPNQPTNQPTTLSQKSLMKNFIIQNLGRKKIRQIQGRTRCSSIAKQYKVPYRCS